MRAWLSTRPPSSEWPSTARPLHRAEIDHEAVVAVEVDADQVGRKIGEHHAVATRAVGEGEVAHVRAGVHGVVVLLRVVVEVEEPRVEGIEEHLRALVAEVAVLRARRELEQFAAPA
ncbi:MAG: hypothetical protein ACK559_24935, partial [bacterium]